MRFIPMRELHEGFTLDDASPRSFESHLHIRRYR